MLMLMEEVAVAEGVFEMVQAFIEVRVRVEIEEMVKANISACCVVQAATKLSRLR